VTRGIPTVAGRPGRDWDEGRITVVAAYFFNGFAQTSWMVRLPSIRSELDADSTMMGAFLTAGAIGTLAMIAVAGVLVGRLGVRRSYHVATGVFLLGYAVLSLALAVASAPLLFAGGLLHGAAFALTNVPQSIAAAASERRIGRTILPQFHASFSIGAALGAGAGGLASQLGVAATVQFLVLVAAAAVARPVIGHRLRCLDASIASERDAARRRRDDAGLVPASKPGGPRDGGWFEPVVVLVSIIAFSAALSEGAANNWVSIALVDAFRIGESEAAIAVTIFLVAQTVVRLVGGALIDRIGRRAALFWSCACALVGVAVFVFAPAPELAYVGTALWGAGSALVVPIGIALVARDVLHGPARVAAVTSVASVANIAGPPIIGLIGSALGVRASMLVVALVVAVAMTVVPAATRPLWPRR
jgi:MFS family permease